MKDMSKFHLDAFSQLKVRMCPRENVASEVMCLPFLTQSNVIIDLLLPCGGVAFIIRFMWTPENPESKEAVNSLCYIRKLISREPCMHTHTHFAEGPCMHGPTHAPTHMAAQ